RETRELLERRDRADVQAVARVRVERADASLAEDDLLVAGEQDRLRREQELLQGRGHSTLEENGASGLPCGTEQRHRVHVPRSDRDGVRVLGHERHLSWLEGFRDYREARLVADRAQEREPLAAEALECVRRRAWLEGPAPQDRGAGRARGNGRTPELLLRFDRARTGDEDDLRASDRDAADFHDRLVRAARGEGERLGVHPVLAMSGGISIDATKKTFRWKVFGR